MERITLSRREALIASVGLFVLPSCAGQLNAGISSSNSSKVPQGSVRRYKTAKFPIARPDGTVPALKLGQSASTDTASGSFTTETYEGITAYIYADESYAEFYDSSGDLQLQTTLSYASSDNMLTATAVGPSQSVTATTPNIADVLSAGSAEVGTASGTFDSSTSTASVTDSTTGLTTQESVDDTTGTIEPPESLSSLTVDLPVVGPSETCVDGRCTYTVHRENTAECALALIAIAMLAMVLADLALDGAVAACDTPVTCAAYWALVIAAVERMAEWGAAYAAQVCAQ